MMEYTVNYKDIADLKVYKNINQLSAGFFDILTDLITEKLSVEKDFSVALSGGSTPMNIYKYLSIVHSGFQNWEKLKIYWGDERCVPPDSEESNYGNAWKILLSKINIPEENIHRMIGEDDPGKEIRRYTELLKRLDRKNGLPAFDLVILGLGEDGHTASIFPDRMDLLSSENWVETAIHPESGQKRITLTGKVLNNASNIIFLATGANKRQKIHDIFNDKESAKSYPAYNIRPHNGKIMWLTDIDAAGIP